MDGAYNSNHLHVRVRVYKCVRSCVRNIFKYFNIVLFLSFQIESHEKEKSHEDCIYPFQSTTTARRSFDHK